MTRQHRICLDGGAVLTGTADEILTAWGAMAFPPYAKHDAAARADLKVDLAKRAWTWGGDRVDPDLGDDEFVEAIGRTRLIAGWDGRN